MKGETVDEISGAAEVMREKATHVLPEQTDHLVDTCGTGGDNAHTFNISTAAAFAAAGAGARVAKHGNRSVSSKSGSADVLEALGVKIAVSPETMKQCLDEAGICFLFAPSLHPAMKYAIGPRKEIGVRTIFNILGPLTNPSLAPAQVLGVYAPNLAQTMAGVLNNMGSRRAFVVHGSDGLDEITITGPTGIAEARNGTVSTYSVEPGDFGIRRSSPESVRGGTPQENAEIIRHILAGKPGPCRDITVLNAAFALVAAGVAATPADGVRMAAESLDSGAAAKKLEMLVHLTGI
jgi:anthranilate phosphoribosyltransferase